MLYKKSNTVQKKEVSAMLSVLPKEMDAFRPSLDRVIAKKEAFKKKKLPVHPSHTDYIAKAGAKTDEKPSVIVDSKKDLHIQVPVAKANMVDFGSLKGLITIHFRIFITNKNINLS